MADVRTIPVSSIDANPWQPRTSFRDSELQDLASSIKQHGILQPVVVTAARGGRYRLVAGERRLRAAKLAGVQDVPALVRPASDEESLALALVENIQREDLNAIERARAYEQLMRQFGLTQEQAAKRLGKSRAAVANALRLLTLPEVIQRAVRDGRLSEGHAKVIAGLAGSDQQLRFFERVVQTGASVREAEDAVRKLAKRRPPAASSRTTDAVAERARRALERALGTNVAITRTRSGGTITIHFYSDEELLGIVESAQR